MSIVLELLFMRFSSITEDCNVPSSYCFRNAAAASGLAFGCSRTIVVTFGCGVGWTSGGTSTCVDGVMALSSIPLWRNYRATYRISNRKKRRRLLFALNLENRFVSQAAQFQTHLREVTHRFPPRLALSRNTP